MNLKQIAGKQRSILVDRDKGLVHLDTLHDKISLQLFYYLIEQTHKFYQPELEKLQIQLYAIQEYMLHNKD